LALAVATLPMSTGCDEEEAGRAFRDAASSELRSGLKSIMDAVIDGMFAVFELSAEGDGGTTSSE
jgi:hypothetical protein